MAAAARMLSLAREEIPVVANELASTARASATSALESSATVAVRAGEKEMMNPVAVRQMAEMTVKEAGESSILGQHLSLTRSAFHQPPPVGQAGNPSSLLETLSTTVETSLSNGSTSTTSTTTSVIAQTLEQDVGVSIKEAISNAGQTGVEEVVEEMGETAKAMLGGHGSIGAAVKPAAV